MLNLFLALSLFVVPTFAQDDADTPTVSDTPQTTEGETEAPQPPLTEVPDDEIIHVVHKDTDCPVQPSYGRMFPIMGSDWNAITGSEDAQHGDVNKLCLSPLAFMGLVCVDTHDTEHAFPVPNWAAMQFDLGHTGTQVWVKSPTPEGEEALLATAEEILLDRPVYITTGQILVFLESIGSTCPPQ